MSPHLSGDALLFKFSTFSHRAARYCIAGSVAFRGGSSRVTNTSLVFHRRRIIHRYDKIHLFRPTLDHRYFAPGADVRIFNAQIGRSRIRCGVVICYDLRFPELARALASQGMDLLFVPARWPVARDQAWRTLLQARAIENQIFVAGCNARGVEGGYSYVFAPTGECLFQTKGRASKPVEFVELDLTLRDTAHKLHRNLEEAVYLKSMKLPARIKRRS